MRGERFRNFLSRQCALAAQIFRDCRNHLTAENVRAAVGAAPLKLKELAADFQAIQLAVDLIDATWLLPAIFPRRFRIGSGAVLIARSFWRSSLSLLP